MEVAYQVRAAHAHRRGARRRRRLRAAMGGMVVLVAVAVASHLTRDDTLTVGQVLRLAGQFRAFRPGALVGLTIPTVPALRRNNVVLRPGLGSPTVLSWSGSSSHGVPVSCNALGRVSAQLAQGLDERVGADLFKPWRSRWNLRLVCGEIVVCRHRRGATGGQSARCGTSLASRAGHWRMRTPAGANETWRAAGTTSTPQCSRRVQDDCRDVRRLVPAPMRNGND